MEKNTNKFKLNTLIFSNGERYPILIDQNGMPDYWSTVYLSSQVRVTSQASGTLEQILKAVNFFKTILSKLKLDEEELLKRIQAGNIFKLYELEYIVNECKYFLKDIQTETTTNFIPTLSIKSLEKIQSASAKTNKNFKTVSPATAKVRLLYISQYIFWFVKYNISKLDLDYGKRQNLIEENKEIQQFFKSMAPSAKRSNLEAKEGLNEEEVKELFKAIRKDSEHNIWKDEFTKARNELILFWLFQFGLRRGELLNIRISDIDFQKEDVTIKRRPDDPNDERRTQPRVKTNGRKLSIPSKLVNLTYDYILNQRSKLPKAKSHDFLIVAAKTGNPMSIVNINKIFEQLRDNVDLLPKNLSAHSLRHTWNDNFSKQIDSKNIPEEREQQMRNYLMGWKDGSSSAQTYTRRHTRNKANNVIKEMGENLIRGEDTDDK